MNEVEAVKILQSMCDIHQLWKPVSHRSTRKRMATHEFDSIYIRVFLDEGVDVTVIHPFRHKRKLVRL